MAIKWRIPLGLGDESERISHNCAELEKYTRIRISKIIEEHPFDWEHRVNATDILTPIQHTDSLFIFGDYYGRNRRTYDAVVEEAIKNAPQDEGIQTIVKEARRNALRELSYQSAP